MDAKVTLAFDQDVIQKAKAFASNNDMSLSRLTEFLLRQITSGQYKSLNELPVADWVNQVAEGEAQYITKAKNRKQLKADFYENKK